ncbi:MAG: GntR family transcriptional regulator [Chloroflexota bacterium]
MADLHRAEPIPLYYQVEMDLRRAIEAGQVVDGRLPTEEELVERYRVSRITVRTALRRLEEDGLIERHRRRGTFVRPGVAAKIERDPGRLLGFEDDLRRQGADPSIHVLGVERVQPTDGVAQTLSLRAGDLVYRVRRSGEVNGEPLWLESRYYPEPIGRVMIQRDLSGASLTRMLETALGVRVSTGRMRVEAAAANRRQAHHLRVRAGHPLLVNQFAIFDAEGRPLEVLRAAFRGDRYAFSFDLGPSQSTDITTRWRRPSDIGPASWPHVNAHLQPVHALITRRES